MSRVMVAVRPRTTALAPSRLHGALRVQPLVAVAIGDAYSVICTLADAAGARATRPPAPNAAAVAAARTDISFVFRAWLIGGGLSGLRLPTSWATSADAVAAAGGGGTRRTTTPPAGVNTTFL